MKQSKVCPICGKEFEARNLNHTFCSYHCRGVSQRKGEAHKYLGNVWRQMVARCHDRKHKDYKDYGGRGISVCEEWRNSFKAFFDWAIENGYKRGLSIDRIDNNSGYCADNCRFTTTEVQANNKRNNTTVVYQGEEVNLNLLCKRLNLNTKVITDRLRLGWTLTDAIQGNAKPLGKLIEFAGTTLSMNGWDKKLGFRDGTVRDRLLRGWTIEETLTTPLKQTKESLFKET